MRIINQYCKIILIVLFVFLFTCFHALAKKNIEIEKRIDSLLAKMTLEEKLGQMSQYNVEHCNITIAKENIRKGAVGSFLNSGKAALKNSLQRIAIEESRLGIPIIFGADVIHGFRTIFPIPIGMASTWDYEIIKKASRIAAIEASANGERWTFAPMIDITRDPRWGRIAETLGEDPYLTSRLAVAMVEGFQGESLKDPKSIAACGKHYVGYGAAEAGKDYNSTYIPERQLRDIFLPPYKAIVKAGAATIMSAFNDINGVPASGNEFTLKKVLREEWGFKGYVVSDWTSITEMIAHGYCVDGKEAAYKALKAGVDMEMSSLNYLTYIKDLISEGKITIALVDESVRRILRIKYKLGLFENPYTDTSRFSMFIDPDYLKLAKKVSIESIVMLKNENRTLPLSKKIKTIAIIGPMADKARDQLGTWVLRAIVEDTKTPLNAIKEYIGSSKKVLFSPGLKDPYDMNKYGFREAVKVARKADVVLLFVGEGEGVSGEARCRAFLNLPGAQEELIKKVASVGKPVILIILAGRPLVFNKIEKDVDAVLYAWHPGTMGGPAISDIVFGVESPSGKLPVTFPRTVGQIPIYYSHKNTGRPPLESKLDIAMGIPSPFKGFNCNYLDVDYTPEYPFGYGLSYAVFKYSKFKLSKKKVKLGESFDVSIKLSNRGKYEADEIVQLYVQDRFGSVTRPVKELKKFKRIRLRPGQSKKVKFTIHTTDLAFCDINMNFVTEPGDFYVWVGSSSVEGLKAGFKVVK